MEFQTPENILIVRTDRIGDVVLSLPMISALRECFPAARISMLLRSYTQPLADGYPGLDDIILYDDNGIEKLWGRMLTEIQQQRFDTALVVHPTFRLAMLMARAGISRRVGTAYRWYSFLFTERVYEHRKTAEKHEARYNLSLLKPLGCDIPEVPPVSLSLSRSDEEQAYGILSSLGIKPGTPVAILHPGSGGSAREWPALHFALLAQMLADEGFQVLITGGPGESALVKTVVTNSRRDVKSLESVHNLKTLAGILKQADIFVGNSSGPLHIAAAVGTPVVGFYPPIRACSPVRWGPLATRKRIFVAENQACPRCRGRKCQGNECMALIRPEEVARAIQELIGPPVDRKVSA